MSDERKVRKLKKVCPQQPQKATMNNLASKIILTSIIRTTALGDTGRSSASVVFSLRPLSARDFWSTVERREVRGQTRHIILTRYIGTTPSLSVVLHTPDSSLFLGQGGACHSLFGRRPVVPVLRPPHIRHLHLHFHPSHLARSSDPGTSPRSVSLNTVPLGFLGP